MIRRFLNIFRVPELRNKVLFTLFMLAVYRLGYHIPLPAIDQSGFAEMAKKQSDTGDESAGGRLASYVSLFSGGNLSQSTIFGLGVMPYISASIIFQLLGTVVPSLEKMQKEGEQGRKKIQEWTRYATVPLSMVQAILWLMYMDKSGTTLGAQSLVERSFSHSASFWTMGIIGLTTGSVFLMWLGEQIDEYGLGIGVSLIILAGIVARMPAAALQVYRQSKELQRLMDHIWSIFTTVRPREYVGDITPGKIVFLGISFVFVVSMSILLTQAQRRIPIQQAKHTRGRRIYGGQKHHLPLRVNHGGVMPIIFAQSLMLFPGMLLGMLNTAIREHTDRLADDRFMSGVANVISFLNQEFQRGSFIYIMTEVVMIYFFAYFWTTVQFQPKEMASQLKDFGSFVPGIRPGKRTSDYLERVMMHITYVGAAFLCVIAVIPTAVALWMHIPYMVTAFLGGTGLLIVVSVALDMVQRIEANLLMRNYEGFLDEGRRMKGRQY